MTQSILKFKGIVVFFLLITMSSCDFFNGNGTTPTPTPEPKYSFKDDFFLDMRKENGILAFRNMKHLDQVYEALMERNNKYLSDDNSEEEVEEEMPYLAAFEKFTGVATARQAANKRIAIYDERGSEGKLEGHPFTDEVLATLFNKDNCIKVGCTYIYNPTYGGKQYAVTKNDDKLLADLVKMEPQNIDKLLPRHPRAYRAISNANALADRDLEEIFVGGCFPQGPSTGGGTSGGGTSNPGGVSSNCSATISAFTITPNPPSLSDYTFTVSSVNATYTYEWQYQENNNTVTLTGASVSVSFQETRNYNVTLIVSNSDGQEIETCDKSVTVVGDCTLDVLSVKGAVQINDIIGSPGQVSVTFNRPSIQAILNPGIDISDVVFTINGQQTTVTAANGYTMTYTAICDGVVDVFYTINYNNSGTPCPSITGTKTHNITSTSCCAYEATHTAGGSTSYSEQTFNDKKILYRFCHMEKTFFPNKKGSKLIAEMKYRTKHNGNWKKKNKKKLKITFNGDVYGAAGSGSSAGCACQIPIPLSGEPSPSKQSSNKRFHYSHNMKFKNKKVTVKQLSNSGNDGSWTVQFEAVGTSANTGPLRIKVPQVVNGQNCN